jgi:DNA-binding NarL/FixJ family response regulator/class 3 adenylate cyclase
MTAGDGFPTAPSSGIKVFLIADIRGYTSFTRQHGDEAAGRLTTAFADMTGEVATARHGELIDFRGDEALVGFDSPRQAIIAAVELQTRLIRRAVAEPGMPLYVGMGLDAGEAVTVERGYRGGALNLASRLCSLAGPGEILTTPEVVHLAGAIDEVSFVAHGETRVKGLADPVKVIRVVPDDDPVSLLTASDTGRARPMRVTLADDSVLLREGVARLLSDNGFHIVAQAGTAQELLDAVRDDPPDVAVVDVRMPPTFTDEGLRAAHQIRSEQPEVSVLVLSQYVETSYAMELLAAGASGLGYLLKDRVADVREFTDAVRRVGAGGSVIDPEVVSSLVGRARQANPLDSLTEREREVLTLMAEGRSNQAISERVHLNAKTVEGHVRNIFTKLDLPPAADDHRRVLAVLAFLRS